MVQPQVAAETGRCYREHLAGDAPDTRKAVRMQLITEKEETLGQNDTECDLHATLWDTNVAKVQ